MDPEEGDAQRLPNAAMLLSEPGKATAEAAPSDGRRRPRLQPMRPGKPVLWMDIAAKLAMY
eukprot:8670963-Alexandrium_andersonii.AAC.1